MKTEAQKASEFIKGNCIIVPKMGWFESEYSFIVYNVKDRHYIHIPIIKTLDGIYTAGRGENVCKGKLKKVVIKEYCNKYLGSFGLTN